jgi:hypothetical protein
MARSALAFMLALALVGLGGAGWRSAAALPAAVTNPDCSAARVAPARAAFKTAYAAGKYEEAVAALDGLWIDCIANQNALAPQTAGEIVSDFAIASHHAGDDDTCLEALEQYWPADKNPTAAFRRLSPTLQRAMRVNWNLCAPYCATASMMDAPCRSLEINEDEEKLVPGFHARPCPFRPGRAAVALSDGTCLAILSPRKTYDPSTVDEAKLSDICPRPAVISRVQGRTVVTELKAPAKSFLNSVEFCCHPVELGVDAQGRIDAQPGKDADEGCVNGHYPGTMQDIFRLERGRLVMVGQLEEPWFPAN